WWQTKEYRLDRMLTWAIYDRGFKELLSLKSRRPKLTLRILMIIFVALVFLAAFVPALYSSPYWILGVLLLPGIAALTTATGTAVSAPFTNLLARQEVSQAKKLVEKLHPKIIAITGSYGKSSSKEFLAALLSGSFQDSGNHGRKTVDEAISRTRFSALPSGTKPWASAHGSLYKVVKTQASENTPLGIARRINSSLKPDTNILILEMGAYKRGEIRYLAALFPPHISWITAIGPQHIGLFGSLENIKLAKYEAVRALKENGFAVLPAKKNGR
ncbi:MAG: hypothetical protein HYS86_00510, partial [Candidatus Chisholmbacteria bacterium]|nr:hypothetical protein [Candidatus Chisholmbacteria bacterium]